MLLSSPVENLRSALLYRNVNVSNINCSPSVVDQMATMQSARHVAVANLTLSRKASYGSISTSLCGRGCQINLQLMNEFIFN